MAYLQGVQVLVPEDESWCRADVTGVARYSAVLKDIEPLGARAIFDLRWTNEHAFPVDAKFTLLGVGAFIDVLRSLGDSDSETEPIRLELPSPFLRGGAKKVQTGTKPPPPSFFW